MVAGILRTGLIPYPAMGALEIVKRKALFRVRREREKETKTMPAVAQNRVSPLREENEKKALALVREAIRAIRFGVVTVILQDGLVVQVERTEKQRILTRREIGLSGDGDGI